MAVNIIALDLGQASDPTTLVFLERPVWATPQAVERFLAPRAGWCAPSELNPHQLMHLVDLEAPELPVLSLRGLKRYELGTRYPVIVEDVARLIAAQPHRLETALVIDRTGAGAPVSDLF